MAASIENSNSSPKRPSDASLSAENHSAEISATSSELDLSIAGASPSAAPSLTRQHSNDSAHNSPFIVNCCSGYIEKPVKWGPLPLMVAQSYLKNPILTAVRYPNCKMTNNKMMYFLWVFTCHRIPAFLMDSYMRLIGKKPRMMSMYRKLHRSMETLAFFTQRHWEWEVRSLRHMQHLIEGQQDSTGTGAGHTQPPKVNWGEEWNTSVKNIDWSEYLENFCVGTKCFVLNEEMSELHLARQRMSRLKTLHYLFNIFTAAIVWRVIMLKSEVASKLWNALVRVCFKWIEYLRISRFVTL